MSARLAARQPSAPSGSARWPRGPSEPKLAGTAVHVWRVDLASIGDEVAASLSADELERARRIAGEDARRLWSRSRGVLRELLARYLRESAGAVELAVGQHGKPELADGRQELFFNLSHSRRLALYAFTAAGPVGVDVELAREEGARAVGDRVALARRAFGEAEADRLGALQPVARERELLRLWTRHEAELKRRGAGIGAARAEDQADGEAHAAPWVVELDVGARAVAALAAERGAAGELHLWEWA
jgi:4'-phosphopantetheinyl transferase